MEKKPPQPPPHPRPADPATLQSIEAAMELVKSKKEALKQAFHELESHSPFFLSSSFSTWDDIESHFSALHSSVILKLASVQHEQEQRQQGEVRKQPPRADLDAEAKDGCSRMVARPALRELCEGTDGEGLIKYMVTHVMELEDVRAELEDALDGAGNVVELVLRVAGGFQREYKNEKDKKSAQRNRIMVMDVFMHLMRKAERKGESTDMIVSDVARERARNLAAKWKRMLEGKELTTKMWVEVLAWLILVGCFRLAGEHDLHEILEYCTICGHYIRSCELCQGLELEDKVPGECLWSLAFLSAFYSLSARNDAHSTKLFCIELQALFLSDWQFHIIEKLLEKGKQLLAVKFIMFFGLKEKFPPMPLIESHVDDALKVAQNARNGGIDSHKAQNVARSRELSALKSAIKVIREHKLELEYPTKDLEARIQLLQNVDRRPTREGQQPSRKQREKQNEKRKGQDRGKEQLNGRKRPRAVAFSGRVSIPTTKVPENIPSVPTFQQSYPPTAVATAYGPPSSFMTSTHEPYHLVSSAATVTSYPVPSNGLYGAASAPTSYSCEANPAQHYVYPSQSQTSSLYYDRPNPYGGYAYPSPYYQSYYPQ